MPTTIKQMNPSFRFTILSLFIFITNIYSVTFGSNLNPGLVDFANEASINTVAPGDTIIGTITGGTSVCINSPQPFITFTAKGGTAPYTFVYQINGVSDISITTTNANNTYNLFALTNAAGTFNYKLISVKDAKSSAFLIPTGTATIIVKALPVVDFSFLDNQCSGIGVQFTPTLTGSYSYLWTFGDGTTSVDSNPTHLYAALGNGTQNFTVSLSITNKTTSCQNNITKNITVKQTPDAALNGTGSGSTFNGISLFKICNNSVSTFTFTNASTTSTFNKKYKINWGDGSPDFESTSWTSTTHIYQIGLRNLMYTIEGSNGCIITKQFIVFVGSNPAVSLGNPGNTDVCISDSLTFPITGTENNPPGTTYTVTFNDGSSPQTFNDYPPPTFVTHQFLKTSCGTTSSAYLNSFYANIVAENPCAKSEISVVPIHISTPPIADFNLQSNSICTNTQTCFTNTSKGGIEINGNTCDDTPNIIWTISPNTGLTLGSGSYGNDFGSTDQALWMSGSNSICPKFSIPGTYTITMFAANRCGTIQKVQTLCVEPPMIPQFSLDKTQGCIPLTVNATNNTNTANSCPTVSYRWETSFISSNCGSLSGVTFNSTTTNPIFHFTNPGTYTIKLTALSSCSPSQSSTQTVIVSKPPTVSINSIANFCGPTSINPTAVINSCGTPTNSLTYAWSFPGGSPASSTSLNPTNISYNFAGTYTISLIVTNECGISTTAKQSFVINEKPQLTNTSLTQTICSGLKPDLVILTSNPPNATYSWIATATPGITGYTPSGNSNSLPIVPIFNSTNSPGTVTYSITPSLGSCTGETVTFTITVNPSAKVTFSPLNQIICSEEKTNAVTLSSTTTGVNLSWSTEQPAGILEAIMSSGTNIIPAQTLTNSTDKPISIIYKAKATLPGATSCEGVDYFYTITVKPKPVIVGSLSQTICSGTTFSFSPANGAGYNIPTGTQYKWNAPIISPAGSLTGANLQSTPLTSIGQRLVNTSSAIATATYSVTPITNDCAGSPFEIVVTVYPNPTVNSIPNVTLCNNDSYPELLFTGIVPGTVYNWVSDNTAIGIASNGTDKITAFTATNTGTKPITATITVTPTYKGANLNCDGTPLQFSITVNSTGQVNNPGNINACNGKTQSVDFNTNNTGGNTTYEWTNSNTNLGLGASGSGNILFTPINNGISVLTTTITVVPTFSNNGISCKGKSEQFTITVNPTPTVNQPVNQVVCNGYPTAEIKFTGNIPTAIYNWRINDSSIGFTSGGTGDISPFTAVNNGSVPVMATITVTPTINGCSGVPVSFTITVNPSPIFTKQPVSSIVCLGEKPTLLTVSYTNGTGIPTYQWYSNNSDTKVNSTLIPSNLLGTNTSYDPPYSTASTLYYYCVITFPIVDCNILSSEIASVTINQPPVISTVNLEISSGEAFTEIPITQNTDIVPPGTTYTWTEPDMNPPGSISGISSQTTPQPSISQTLTNNTKGIATVTYTIVPTSGTCVGNSFQVIVKVNPPLNPNATINPVTCFGLNDGSITTNIQGGVQFDTGTPYHVLWTGPNSFTSTSASISGLKPGVYDLLITDKLDMKYPISYTITEPGVISVVTTTEKDITCFGAANGEIVLSTSGGTGAFKYNWTKDNAPYATTEDIANLSPGAYEVTVTDVNNCNPKILNYVITQPDSLVITLLNQTTIKCFGYSTGAVTIDVKGGVKIEVSPGIFDYKYSWAGPNEFTSSNKNLTDIPAGIYNLTVTDNSGCGQQFKVEIIESAQIVILATTTPIGCYGANDASLTLTISGGVPPYDSQWDNFASDTVQNNLSAGDYTITVTDDNACQSTITVNIPEAPLFKVMPVVKNVSCYGANDGSIALNFEGGKLPISLTWTDNSASGTTRNNIGPGTYTVNILDGAPCIISKTFVIVEPLPLTLTAATTNAFDCTIVNGGAIDLLAAGGTSPYSYSWSNGATTEDISHIPAGEYVVTVTDSIGCQQTASYVILRPAPIEINVTTTIDYDCNSKEIKGISTAIIKGGIPPYQLSWSTGSITGANHEIMETDQSGLVILTVTDTLGCITNHTFSVDIPTIGLKVQLLNCNQHAYQLNAVVPNDLEKYTYDWDFDDGTSSTIKNPQHTYNLAGNYKIKLIVTGPDQCVSEYVQLINAEELPTVSLDRLPKFCEGDSILIYALGAQDYKWNDGTYGDSILIKQPGEYSVIGFSKAGCTDTIKFTASYFEPLIYTIQTDKTEVTTDQNELQLWSENIPYSNYSWDFGDGYHGQGDNLSHTFVAKDGYYDVNLKVINPNGCIEVATKRIMVSITSYPNTFTPNGDGINDIYLVGWHIQVYNRNGFLMYEGKEGWDGTYNGKPVADDTYFVVIYDSAEKGTKFKTGYVTLIGSKKGL